MDYIYIECAECDFGAYTHDEIVAHILAAHTGYTPQMAEEYATLWEEDSQERQEAEEIEYYRSRAYEGDQADDDPLE
jgi:hypothetical protein